LPLTSRGGKKLRSSGDSNTDQEGGYTDSWETECLTLQRDHRV
jgi:hypothetical protein